MEIFPATTVADLVAQLTAIIVGGIVVIIGVVGLAVGITFVVRWFGNSTNSINRRNEASTRRGDPWG